MKYIKYLFTFLLVFGLTVNSCSIYSPLNSKNYHQVSSVKTRKKINRKHSKVYVYAKKIRSKKAEIARITYRNLRDAYTTQIQILLKLRITLYKKIDSKIAETVFLNQRTTSSTIDSCLYLA